MAEPKTCATPGCGNPAAYRTRSKLAYCSDCIQRIAFPLISSGIFHYPKEEAWRVALTACASWLHEHDDAGMQVTFCVLSAHSKALGDAVLASLL